ncbi:diguanylate cyclase [Phytohabitans sp. ZYX-F-186]|uniref:Diguanylate cyclase n=1 Tax=Phytohabitans maris TaxID=3071409 RepID=A0ABU0ZR91_9ACTN|nr:diguanylate cyclase [Phytohabitans sp. ZYX-F-186]MDQ7909488.1 diguanylate cyclase [Phytohabitans sp. ZYX-F-186]
MRVDGDQRRFVRRAAGAAVAWLALFALLTGVSQGSETLARFVGNVVYVVPVALLAPLSYLAARRARGRLRTAWRLLAVSNLLWLAGELTWSGYAYLRPGGAPTPSFADVAYLASYAVALPAIVIGFGGAQALRRARGIVDSALITLGVGAVGWALVIGPLLPGTTKAGAIVTFAQPLLAVSIVTALVVVGLCCHRGVPPSFLLAGASFAVAGLTDAGYAYLFMIHSYGDASWLNLGWQLEAVLLCLAAAVAARRTEPEPEVRGLDRDLAVLPAAVAVLSIVGLAAADRFNDGRLTRSTLVIAVLLVSGLLLRQVLVTRDRTRLAAALTVALREQERLAVTDGLTGLYNRRFFQEMLRLDAERAERDGHAVSLVMIDLDRFKRINDTCGHPAGDRVLVEAADRIRRAVRPNDLVARYGGEEFVCLLPGAGEETALEVAEQVRRALSRTPLSVHDGHDVRLTASLGVASAGTRGGRAHGDLEGLIHDADGALYRAKARGRDQVAAASRVADLALDTDPDLPPALVWLADQIDAKLGSHEHSTAVSRWSLLTGARLGLHQATLRRTAAAARLHDIGKINVDDAILTKPGRLGPAEWDVLRRHPEEGARLLTELSDRADLAPLVGGHHERYDGTGYPSRLRGDGIPIEARIIAVCDSWAAMRADRAYAAALCEEEARQQIQRGRGTQFDPAVVDAFLALLDEGAIDDLAPLRHVEAPTHA